MERIARVSDAIAERIRNDVSRYVWKEGQKHDVDDSRYVERSRSSEGRVSKANARGNESHKVREQTNEWNF